MQSVRNAFRKIYEPGTAFLLEGHENPSNLRRAIAYGGDIGGSLILAPLIAGTGASIGGALYNTAVPEPMEIPTQTLADLASLAAMGYGGYRALNRFNNAGGWQGLQGKFGRGEAVGRETIVSPASVPPPASTVAADPWEINPEAYSNSNDFSVWDDPPSAPSFLGIPQPSPAPPPPAPPYSALPFTGIALPQRPSPPSPPPPPPPSPASTSMAPPAPAPAPVAAPVGVAVPVAAPPAPARPVFLSPTVPPTIPVAPVEILPPDPSPPRSMKTPEITTISVNASRVDDTPTSAPRSMKQADSNPPRPSDIPQEVWDTFTLEQQKQIAGI